MLPATARLVFSAVRQQIDVRFQFHEAANESNDCQAQRAPGDHDASASNEGLSSMNPAQKALWFIESHLAEGLTLDEIAGVAGISRFHMVRAFAAATGLSVMRYVRARRLSEAARALANGAPDILTLALDADYGSHEAFTRAFRDHFGVTPEAVRGSGASRPSSASGADRHGFDRHRQSSTAAFCDRQAAARRWSRRALHLGVGCRHSRPVAALSPIRRQHSGPDREGGLRRLLQWR
jgi:AraC-like DNA-binding protein